MLCDMEHPSSKTIEWKEENARRKRRLHYMPNNLCAPTSNGPTLKTNDLDGGPSETKRGLGRLRSLTSERPRIIASCRFAFSLGRFPVK